MNAGENLLLARRALDVLSRLSIIDDWHNDLINDKWFLLCKLVLSVQPTNNIPKDTFWYIVVDDFYPKGNVKIYPAVQNGINVTFHHQSCNQTIDSNGLWRTGALCLETTIRALGAKFDVEPLSSYSRLLWHARRALDWIDAAANDKLILNGDVFESPQFCDKTLDIVAFQEDSVSYMQWESIESKYGILELSKINSEKPIFAVCKYFNDANMVIKENIWGSYISESTQPTYAIWVKLDSMPITAPYDVPISFSELKLVLNNSGIKLTELLKNAAYKLRDGKRHFLLLGFSVPERYGEDLSVILWQACLLPTLSYGKKTKNGFRTNTDGYLARDLSEVLTDDTVVDWIDTQNWGYYSIYNRGRHNSELTSKSFLIIGAGTIGASLSEMFVRAGINRIGIVDFDILCAGNLARHTLSIKDINTRKSTMLANRLNAISIHAQAKAFVKEIAEKNESDKLIDDYDVIIDCTGDDNVIEYLSNIYQEKEKIWGSVSIGYAANNLYLCIAKSKVFPHDEFYQKISSLISSELRERAIDEFPRDGVGCWHPLFPARSDDIWMVASVAVKEFEKYITDHEEHTIIKTYIKKCEDNFIGYSQIG